MSILVFTRIFLILSSMELANVLSDCWASKAAGRTILWLTDKGPLRGLNASLELPVWNIPIPSRQSAWPPISHDLPRPDYEYQVMFSQTCFPFLTMFLPCWVDVVRVYQGCYDSPFTSIQHNGAWWSIVFVNPVLHTDINTRSLMSLVTLLLKSSSPLIVLIDRPYWCYLGGVERLLHDNGKGYGRLIWNTSVTYDQICRFWGQCTDDHHVQHKTISMGWLQNMLLEFERW